MGAHARNALLAVIVGAVFLDTLAYGMIVPMLPSLGRLLGFGQTGAGVVLASYAAGIGLGTPAAGLAIRRWGDRLPLLIGVGGLTLSLILFVVATDLVTILIARTLQGAASGTIWTTGLTAVADRYPARQRGPMMGSIMAAFAIGLMAGPPFGGFASDWLGPRLAFTAPGAFGIVLTVTAVATVRLLSRRMAPGPVPAAQLLRDPSLLGLAVVVAAVAAVMGLLEPTLPLYLEQRFGTEPSTIGVLFGLVALALAIGSPIAGRCAERVGAVSTIRWAAYALVVLLPLFALAPGALWTAPVFAATGLACAAALAPVLPGMAERVDAHGGRSYAVAYALFNLAFALGLMVGPLAGAALASNLGLLPTLLLTAGLLAAGTAGMDCLALARRHNPANGKQ
ncbi:MAG: MFS transporter [Ectothiorhodospiraceae bacterium]